MTKWKQYSKLPFILVSTDGLLVSLKNPNKPYLVKQRKDKDGYKIVTIRDKANKNYTLKVHRMVAETFLDNPNNLPLVNHKDEVKHHNNVTNLEWCDAKYNREYSKEAKLLNIRLTNKITGQVKLYRGLNQVAKEFDCTIGNVNHALKVKEPKIGIFKNYKTECWVV